MNKTGRVLTILAAGLALLSAVGCEKLRARDQINKGVQSYKNAKYEEAIEHFKNAVQLDPSLLNARLYLATAYMQQYIRRKIIASPSRRSTSSRRCWIPIRPKNRRFSP
jgi:tetratricopeptide (TPR) repeat protein